MTFNPKEALDTHVFQKYTPVSLDKIIWKSQKKNNLTRHFCDAIAIDQNIL